MEIFLQLYDDLDDLAGAVRFAWPKVLGLLFALVLFAATGLVCILLPKLFLGVTAALLPFLLAERIRVRLRAAELGDSR